MEVFKGNFPIINISNLIQLRELHVSDVVSFYDYYINPEVHQYIPSDIPTDIKEARDEIIFWKSLFNRGKGIYWGVANTFNDELVGMIGLNKYSRENNRIELSFELSKDYWGRGIISSAIEKVLDFAFNEMKINRVEALTSPKNLASCRVLSKNGFIKEGILKEYRCCQSKYHNMAMYSILERKYNNKQNNK